MRRSVIGFGAATFIPPLGALQILAANHQLADGTAWLGVAGILVSSFSAAAIYWLTQLNAEAGNPPVPVPEVAHEPAAPG